MKRIRLRALTLSDIDNTLLWHNQIAIINDYSGHPFPVNKEMELKWYEKILTSNFPMTVFGIEYIENKTLLGITVLKDINLINRSSEFSIYIGNNDYKGKGLSKEASLETLIFGFRQLGLNRIFLKVLEDNEKAIRLYNSIGFIQEGILRYSVFKNNCYKSEILMSVLKDEFHGEL